jgi:hypothetical protein
MQPSFSYDPILCDTILDRGGPGGSPDKAHTAFAEFKSSDPACGAGSITTVKLPESREIDRELKISGGGLAVPSEHSRSDSNAPQTLR